MSKLTEYEQWQQEIKHGPRSPIPTWLGIGLSLALAACCAYLALRMEGTL